MMTCFTKVATLLCVTLVLMFSAVVPAWATSLFSGMVLSQGEGEGARVVEVHPGSPADKAGVKVADLIIELGGRRIVTLNDFVVESRSIDKKVPETGVKVLRRGELLDLVIASYSMPVYQSWKVKVVQPPYTTLSEVSLFQYWVEKGKRMLMEIRAEWPIDRKIANYGEAIKSFFFALHYSPASVDVGLMIADAYRAVGVLHQAAGSMPEALQSYAQAAEFYNKSSDKTSKEKDLQKILADLQDVEERLYRLLPEERSELNPTTQGPDVTGNER